MSNAFPRVRKFAHVVTRVCFTRFIPLSHRDKGIENLRRKPGEHRFYFKTPVSFFFSTHGREKTRQRWLISQGVTTQTKPPARSLARSKARHAHIQTRTNRSCRRYSNLVVRVWKAPQRRECFIRDFRDITRVLAREREWRSRREFLPLFLFFFYF